MRKHGKKLLVALALGSLAASAVFGGLAWASSGSAKTRKAPQSRPADVPVPGVAAFLANQEGITQLRALVQSSDGSAAVVAGSRDNIPVRTIVIDGAAAPFFAEEKLLASSPLRVQSGMGGKTLSSVDSFFVAGVVAPTIAGVVIEYGDGNRVAADIVEGAFAKSLSPTKGGVRVIAYDSNGVVVTSTNVPAPSPPGG
jgi:hypothetical protein